MSMFTWYSLFDDQMFSIKNRKMVLLRMFDYSVFPRYLLTCYFAFINSLFYALPVCESYEFEPKSGEKN